MSDALNIPSSTSTESSSFLLPDAATSAHSLACKTPPNSPWGVSATLMSENMAKITPFEDVMSEQLATQLQLHENHMQECDGVEDCNAVENVLEATRLENHDDSTDNDAVLAQMLQAEMDREFNQYITRQENQVNKNSKVKLTYDKFRTDELFASSGEETEDSDEEDGEWLLPTCVEKLDPASSTITNKKGYVKMGKEVVTKHDKEMCGRRNTARMEDRMPPAFPTGDARGMDLQLSNGIYNRLKKHALSEEKRTTRLHENKEFSTAEHAIDDRTRLILHRMMNRGIVDSVSGVVSVGKEAVVVHVDGGDLGHVTHTNAGEVLPTHVPDECVVKIYKTTLNEFRTRDKYIKDDYRFKDRFKKLNPRKIIHMWAEKEMHNLMRITEAGIPCPEVVLLRKHVLLMSFIGRNRVPAPKLKNAALSQAQRRDAYDQVVGMMKTLYRDCKLIHADLNEFNLLWHDKKVWVIDVSQSVEPSHPHGLEFLLRDCKNISKFFTNLGVEGVLPPMQLFNLVSGLNLPCENEVDFLATIERLEESEEEHAHQARHKSSRMLDPHVT